MKDIKRPGALGLVLPFEKPPTMLEPESVSVFDNKNSNCSALPQSDEWLTTEEAANYLRISPDSLRNLTSSGQIPYYKLQRRNRYRISELRELILTHKRGGEHGI